YNFAIALKTGQKFSFFGNNSDEVTNFVVAGVDEDGYRTDLILFCQLDSAKNKLHIMQVPRDTKIQNNRNDKKINSAYFSGIDCLKSEIESVIGLKAEHHVIITFDAFSNLIDALGGVKIDVPIRMKYEDPTQNLNIDLQPGVQVLDGEHAQMFMRYRKNNDGGGYPDGDVGRMAAQRNLYSAISDKLLSPASIFKIPSLYRTLKKDAITDLKGGDIFNLMFRSLKLKTEDITMYTIPGEGKYIGGVSYFVPDKTETKKIIDENFSREVPSSKKDETGKKTGKNGNKKINTSKNNNIDVNVIDASGKNKLETVVTTLKENGFNVKSSVEWEESRSKSSLIDYSNNNASEEVLKIFGNIPVTKDENPKKNIDATLIIGKDFNF
ncbi:MAG: LCP family protein, partial [Oscillospiraceae bacterium]